MEQFSTVEKWFGEPGGAKTWGWADEFDEDRYDIIVVWQLWEAFELLSGRHPNVIFVPMYDAMLPATGEFYWNPVFNTAKIACFSWALRREVMRRGAVNAGFQYYPDPAHHALVEDFNSLRGHFWYRTRQISPNLIFQLCRGTNFEHFVVHNAPDPGHEADALWTAPPNIKNLEYSHWSTEGDEYAAALHDANIFFAPRRHEGIGMTTLEAMASGHCVVAPNAAAMNEYISNGTNGLLYIPQQASQLDFRDARLIAARARESSERGHERWLTSIPALLDFVTTPTATLRGGSRSIIPVRNRFTLNSPPSQTAAPLISVITVCRDAAPVLEATMESILGQIECDFEYIVVDGQSTDDSLDIIRRHSDRIATWRSSKDNGAYEAMNAALELARGEWVLFMNAGDSFCSEDALRRMFARIPVGADVIYGHHIYRLENGAEELHRAAEFEITWSRLQSGDLWADWLAGIPCHQSTAVRRDLLTRLRFDTRYRIAADHDLLFRARAQGARFFNCDEVVAIYVSGGLSAQQYEQCIREWADIARLHGDAAAEHKFFGHLQEIRMLTAEYEARLAQNRTLTAESEARLEQIHSLTATVEKSQAEVKKVRADGVDWLKQIHSLNRALKKSEAEGEARLEAIHSLTATVEKSQAEVRNVRADGEAWLKQIHSLNRALKKSEAEGEARLEAIHSLTATVEKSQAEVRKVQADGEARLEQIHSLNGALKKSEAEGEARLKSIHSLTATVEKSQAEVRKCQADGEARLEQIHSLNGALKKSEAEGEARLEQIHDLTAMLKTFEAEGEARLGQIHSLTAMLNKSEVAGEVQLVQIDSLIASLEKSQADGAASIRLLNDLQADLADLTGRHATLLADVADLERRAASYDHLIATLQMSEAPRPLKMVLPLARMLRKVLANFA